ncbi:hypothetical protein SAMN04487907_10222 [Zunongwangia mangrovi]|uniref:Uncharacterized protein n=1 Tax=Zunongwangia mangrovi TaxID=1334022 RepID=A0A1I1FX80_9FLAO|nr:hypothetical protein [Zunongwangia mangrovi]SFC03642.1 hypothetical protein SAMN04487907_10222 [Zunongwangia mangrovi]
MINNFCYYIFSTENKPHKMQIRDENDNKSEDYILQKNKKTKVGSTFIAIVLVIIIAIVAMTGVYFDYW